MQTCTVAGCGKKHRAKGLCSTHYNQQLPERHKKITVSCSYCDQPCKKDATRNRRYANLYCSLICQALHGIETGDTARRLALARAAQPPAKEKPEVCRIYPRQCVECNVPFVARRGNITICSDECRRVRARRSTHQWERARRVGGSRSKIKRQTIFERDNFTCWMCERHCPPDSAVPHPLAPTIDHIVPRSLGGTDDEDNLATACFQCNSRRGASWSIPDMA